MADNNERMENGFGKRTFSKKRMSRENYDRDSKYVEQGSEKEKEAMEKLTEEFNRLQLDMSRFTENGQAWLAMKKDEDKQTGMGKMNHIYQRRMLMMCLSPLREGFSPSSIIMATSMYVGLAAANPQIKKTMQKGVGNTLAGLAETGKRDGGVLGGKTMQNVLGRVSKHYIKAGNDGRVPYTPESAAIADICMTREAYSMMRDGKHTVEEVQKMYGDSRKVLYDLMEQDGVSMEDMAQSERIIIGKVVREDKEAAMMFGDIMYDNVSPSKAHVVQENVYDTDENGKPTVKVQNSYVWTGEFENMDGSSFDGVMHARMPMDEEQLAGLVRDSALDHFDYVQENYPDNATEAARDIYGCMFNAMGDTNPGMNIPHYDVKHPSKESDLAYTSYARAMKMGAIDGMSKEQVVRAANLGAGMSEMTAVSRMAYANYGDDVMGMQVSKQALAFATLTAGKDSGSKEYQDAFNSFCDNTVKGYEKSIGEGDSNAQVSADEYRELLSQTTAAYSRSMSVSIKSGMPVETVVERMTECERETSRQWANDVESRIEYADKYGEFVTSRVDDFLHKTKHAPEDMPDVNAVPNQPKQDAHVYTEDEQSYSATGKSKAERRREYEERTYAKQAEDKFADIFEEADAYDTPEYDDGL